MRFRFFCAATLSFCAAVVAYSANELPSPQKDPQTCGRSNPSAVCDPDGYLSSSSADTVDGIINFIEEGSHGFLKNLECDSGAVGAQVAVAVVSNLPFGFESKEDRAFQLARDLHDRWGVGDAVCQNGVVLVLAIHDRAVGLSAGAGVKRVLKDNMVPKIIGVMKESLREKQYGTALEKGVTAIGNIVSGGKPPSDNSGIGSLFVFGAFLSCCGLGACFERRKRRRYARCRQTLQKLDKQRSAANDNNYVATSCPICLEDFSDTSQDEKLAPGETDKETNVQTTTAGHSNSVQAPSNEDIQRTLPCGHKFHEKCILEWISGEREANSLCPICRQPIEGGATVENRTNQGSPSGWDVYDPEYRFRLQRARYYHSDFITWSMLDSWERDRYRRDYTLATSSAFVAVDPVVVAAAARSSGASGSSFSFGGGSSAGGGGGGGGW
eukprot:TRINITY_DN2321_c0_g1_i1.p1 TRINITY_DN2321_c0_g1~~TRINITY_DN2321_c0_g1_i1.p1  ORF type:complete len:440 (+),score=58.75 TRINITY_DN2321_c0_g1_i1:185-1504(+)